MEFLSIKHPDLLSQHPEIDEFTTLMSEEWKNAVKLVNKARREQNNRKVIRMPVINIDSTGMKITP